MYPYLQSKDLLVWEVSSDLRPGDLVVYSNLAQNPVFVVHRLLRSGESKGDREKWTDQDAQRELKPLGRVKARISKGQFNKPYPIQSGSLLGRTLTYFSFVNSYKKPILHRLAGLSVLVIGHTLRWQEERKTWQGEG